MGNIKITAIDNVYVQEKCTYECVLYFVGYGDTGGSHTGFGNTPLEAMQEAMDYIRELDKVENTNNFDSCNQCKFFNKGICMWNTPKDYKLPPWANHHEGDRFVYIYMASRCRVKEIGTYERGNIGENKMRVEPLEYYKLRNRSNYPSIKSLEDDYGCDSRMAYPPYLITSLSIKGILEFKEAIKEHITNGKVLVNIAERIRNESNPFIKESIKFEWEVISGLKHYYGYGGRERACKYIDADEIKHRLLKEPGVTR